jgi:uncharacterized protein (DUF885 family)
MQVSTRATHQDHANIGQLAERYLAVCYPVDLQEIDLSSYGAVAESLTADGMDHAADVRNGIVNALRDASCSDQDLVACGQLLDWVSAEQDLQDSGEKYRPLSQIDAPHARISRALRASLSVKPVDWSAVCDGVGSVADCLREELGLLKRGAELGFASTQREATFAHQRYLGMSGRASYWLDASLRSDGDISLSQEAQIHAATVDVSAAADDLVNFLADWYLPRATDQQGFGRERYALWCRKLLGDDLDLDDLYESMWAELRETMSQTRVVAAQMNSGGSVRDLVWSLGADLAREVDVAEGLPRWIQDTVQAEALAVDAQLLRLPPGTTDFALSGFGDDLADVLEVHSPRRGGGRGVVLVRALNNMQISTWALTPLVHLQIIPGEHLFNCFLVDPDTPLQRFQRVLVNHAALSGWMSQSMMLTATEIERDDDLYRLNALLIRTRELVCALGDIGFHLGLKIPADAPDFAGETWTDELQTQAIAQWAHLQRDFAKNRVAQTAMNPAYALGPIVGSRVRDEGLQRARSKVGAEFDLRSYHDRVLRLAPTGIAGLRAQLDSIVSLV